MTRGKNAQVQEELRRRITDGRYPPGTLLPSVSALMEEFGIRSRGTVTVIVHKLRDEGLVEARTGKGPQAGTWVRNRKPVQRDLAAGLRTEQAMAVAGDTSIGLFELMASIDPDDVEVRIDYDPTDAPDGVAHLLGVLPGAPVLKRTFLFLVKGEPHQLATSYLPDALAAAAGLTGPDCERPGVGTIAQLRAAGTPVGRIELWVEARMPTPEDARDLAIPRGTPVLEHGRVMYRADDDKPVEFSTAIVRSDQVAYRFDIDLARA